MEPVLFGGRPWPSRAAANKLDHMPMLDPLCSEKVARLREFAVTTRAYAQSVSSLQRMVDKANNDAYVRFYRATEDARARFEPARIAYEKHVTDHGC